MRAAALLWTFWQDPVILEAAARVRAAARDRPVLFTFRTHHENGNKPITSEEYRDLNIAVINSSLVDADSFKVWNGYK